MVHSFGKRTLNSESSRFELSKFIFILQFCLGEGIVYPRSPFFFLLNKKIQNEKKTKIDVFRNKNIIPE